MYKRSISLVVALVFLTTLFGCASIPEEHKGAATGAGVGAATGAVAGALLGSKGAKTEMAVLGGLLGALAGGAIGHYAYDKKKTREDTSAKYNYKSSQGVVLRIEEATVVPATVKGGDTIDIKATYAVLTPDARKDLSVNEIREIRYEGELFGKPEVRMTREDGTYTSTVPVTLPKDAKKGKYTVTITVQAENVSDSKGTSFNVN